MINSDMGPFNFYTFGEPDAYSEPQLSEEVQGSIKISINVISQSITDTVNYNQTTYMGLTRDTKVNETYVIDYKGKKLKVLYVNPKGRLTQVYLTEL